MNFMDSLSGRKPVAVEPADMYYPAPDSLKIPAEQPEPNPDWDVVRQYQEEPPVLEIPVSIRENLRVNALPAKRGIWRSYRVPAYNANPVVDPVEIIPGDPRIKSVILKSFGNNPGNIYLGTREQLKGLTTANATTDAFLYDSSTPIGPFEGFEEPTYAYADVNTGTNVISVRIQFWAD